MSGFFYVHADEIDAAIKHLDAAIEDTVQGCNAITIVKAEQGGVKWGTQPGAIMFSRAYTSALSSLEDSIMKQKQLIDQIDQLRVGMKAIRQDAETIDEDTAANRLKLQPPSLPAITTGP